jgi:hypothetical protein
MTATRAWYALASLALLACGGSSTADSPDAESGGQGEPCSHTDASAICHGRTVNFKRAGSLPVNTGLLK